MRRSALVLAAVVAVSVTVSVAMSVAPPPESVASELELHPAAAARDNASRITQSLAARIFAPRPV